MPTAKDPAVKSAAPDGGPDARIRATITAMAGASELYAHAHGTVAAGATPLSPAQAQVAAHGVKNMLSEQVFYPAHSKRRESPGCRATHHTLVVVEDLPCLACGVRNSTLADPTANPFGAKALETHLHVIEWALANAIDLDKFNHHVVEAQHRRKPTDPTYFQAFSRAKMADWIDHHTDNLWVLCDVHHRHKFVGIHAITMPIWGPQDLLIAGFGPQMADSVLIEGSAPMSTPTGGSANEVRESTVAQTAPPK